MAIRKGKDFPQQSIQIDPAVAVHLHNPRQNAVDAKRQKELGLTAAQRRKRQKDTQRVRDWYDLPVEVKKRIQEISDQYCIPKSQLAAHFLTRAIELYDNGAIDLNAHLKPSIVPRFKFFLDLPEKKNGR